MSGSFWDTYSPLSSSIARTRAILRESGGGVPAPLGPVIEELLQEGGKMLRPGFVILGGRFGRCDEERLCQLAAGVELFHIATLVHDDIVDGAELRRGRPSVPTRLGARDAVLAGDWLLARSFFIMAAHASLPTAQKFASTASRICAGEVREVASEHGMSADPSDYFRRIDGKTAALFSACFRLGATESGCPAELCEQLARVGRYLGMSFQIVDDILDVDGDQGRIGKPVGQDLRNGVYTLPVVYGLASPARSELERLLDEQDGDGGSMGRILQILRESRAVERARQVARRYGERALRLVDRLPDVRERTILADAVSRLTERAA
jgi:heptaprenyl diphosphate synthase